MAPALTYLAHFIAGALLCNCLPHLMAGLQGMRFPTPFGKPPGTGESSAPVNFLWGAGNFAAGVALLVWLPIELGLNAQTLALAAGALLLGFALSRHFGAVRNVK